MPSEKNVKLVEKFYDETINKRDATAFERLLTDDYVHNKEFRGRDGQKQAIDAFITAFPDLNVKTLMTVADEDKVAVHQRWRGTHEGEFIDIPATGKKVEFTSTAILIIHQGMIAQAFDEVDLFGLAAKLSG